MCCGLCYFFILTFSPSPVWALSFGLWSFREKKKKVAHFFQEISISSCLGSHMSCRGYLLHSVSFLSYKEYVLWCNGVPLPPLILVFCLSFPTLLPALLLPFYLASDFFFLFFLKFFHSDATNEFGSALAYSGLVLKLWPSVGLYWSQLERAVRHRRAAGLSPQRLALELTSDYQNPATWP